MELEKEQRAVRPYPELVDRLFKRMPDEQQTCLHFAVGLAGECSSELLGFTNVENLLEEMGDALFYFQAALNHFAWDVEDLADALELEDRYRAPLIGLSIESGNLLDAVKKFWCYNQTLNVLLCKRACANWWHYFKRLMNQHNLTLEMVQQANRNKLAVRYPGDVFSDAMAQARLDKAEEAAALDNAGVTGAELAGGDS